MPLRLDWSPVKVGNWYLIGTISSSPIGNCAEYVVAPATRYTVKSGAGCLCEMLRRYRTAWSQSTLVIFSCFFLTSTTANAKSPPYSNPALTTIKSGSSVETLPAFLDWTTLFIESMETRSLDSASDCGGGIPATGWSLGCGLTINRCCSGNTCVNRLLIGP